MVNCCWYVIST